MRKYVFLSISLTWLFAGCALSFAEGLPPSKLPSELPTSVLPKCDCNPCTCDPKDCKCEGCGVGCRKSASQASATEDVAFVGFEATQAPTAAPVANTAPVGYHLERRVTGCETGTCQVSYVAVADAPTAAPSYGPSPVANSSCASCGTQGTQATGGMSSAFMSRGPVRRFFGRVFRGRCG